MRDRCAISIGLWFLLYIHCIVYCIAADGLINGVCVSVCVFVFVCVCVCLGGLCVCVCLCACVFSNNMGPD